MDEVDGKPGPVVLHSGQLDVPKDAPEFSLCPYQRSVTESNACPERPKEYLRFYSARSSSQLKPAWRLILKSLSNNNGNHPSSIVKINSRAVGRRQWAPLLGSRRSL
jgi:hypothetical protein